MTSTSAIILNDTKAGVVPGRVQTITEAAIIRLRDRYYEGTKGRAWHQHARPEERYHNVCALRSIWEFIRDAEVLTDYLQRAYLVVTGMKPALNASVYNAMGDEFIVALSLNRIRAFQYATGKDHIFQPLPEIVYKRSHKDIRDSEYETLQIQEFCEFTLQNKADKVLVNIHDIGLMKAFHSTKLDAASVERALSVNVDGVFTSSVSHRPYYRRAQFAVPASHIDKDVLKARGAKFCDSVRLLGEGLVAQGCYGNAPKANVTLACFAEVSEMLTEAYRMLNILTHHIVGSVKHINGFAKVMYPVNCEPAKTYTYAPGVVIYSGHRPQKIYSIDKLHTEVVRKFSAAGQLSVEVPRFILSSVHKHGKKVNGAEGRYTPLWKRGQQFLQASIDKDLTKMRRTVRKIPQ